MNTKLFNLSEHKTHCLDKSAICAMAATVIEDLSDDEFSSIMYDTASKGFDYTINSYVPATPHRMPCPSCHEGEPGEGAELDFECTLFDLDIDLDRLPDWAVEIIENYVIEDFTS